MVDIGTETENHIQVLNKQERPKRDQNTTATTSKWWQFPTISTSEDGQGPGIEQDAAGIIEAEAAPMAAINATLKERILKRATLKGAQLKSTRNPKAPKRATLKRTPLKSTRNRRIQRAKLKERRLRRNGFQQPRSELELGN